MKKLSGVLLTFTFVVLQYSLASSVELDQILKGLDALGKIGEQQKLKEEEKRKQQDFDNKVYEILRKLPPTARVIIPEVKLQIPEFETPLPNPEKEKERLSYINFYKTKWESIRMERETYVEGLGIKIVEREAFKEAENEIVYSQTGEVDPSSSAKFGKAVGATHIVFHKALYEGLTIDNPKLTISFRVIEIESMLRLGSATITLNLKQEGSSSASSKQPQNLLNETFYVKPGNYQFYGWTFNGAGTLNINVNANSDIFLYVVDKANLEVFKSSSRSFQIFAIKERITSANFSVSLSKGEYYIIVSNRHSILTTAGVSLGVSFTPQ